jgi:hypothetical protein
MQDFRKSLMQAYRRLEDIKKDPYPDPAIDSVTVAMLVEETNQRARQLGCGHLVVRRDEYEQHGIPADQGMRVIEKMLAWCQDHEA